MQQRKMVMKGGCSRKQEGWGTGNGDEGVIALDFGEISICG